MEYVMSPTAASSANSLNMSCSSAAKKLFSPFSPMDTQPQKICESTTPRRRLSLDVDENAMSPFKTDTDQGYGGSSCSSLEASLNGGGGGGGASEGERRHPLSEIRASFLNSLASSGGGGGAKTASSAHRRTLLARRCRKKVSLVEEPGFTSRADLTSSLNLSRPLTLPDRPASPLSQQSTNQGLFQQINSPLERMNLASPSWPSTSSHPPHPHRSTSLTSSTAESSDGYFSEVFDVEEMEASLDGAPPISDNLSSLISAPVINTPATNFVNKPQFFIGGSRSAAAAATATGIPCPTPMRPSPFQRSDSWSQSLPSKRPSLKRASPCSEVSQLHHCKRPPLPVFSSHSNSSPPRTKPPKGVPLLRSQSCCMPPAAVGESPSSSSSSPEGMDSIGDFSKPYALPLVKGGIADLKSISPDTLAGLLRGEYLNIVDDFQIIDCRYPYEFEGGHVRGAVNIWSKQALQGEFLANPQHKCSGDKRTVYVFHCEFSSQRGPQMSRYLREKDRKQNGMDFPKLHYPELYLLHGGYKTFFEQHAELCEPKSYCCMVDKAHKDDLKLFKQRSKSWNAGESHSRVPRQHNLRARRSTVYDSVSTGTSKHNSPVRDCEESGVG